MTKVSLSISMEAEAAERFRLLAAARSESLSSVVERFALAGEANLHSTTPTQEADGGQKDAQAPDEPPRESIAESERANKRAVQPRSGPSEESSSPTTSDDSDHSPLADGEKPATPDNQDPVTVDQALQDHLARAEATPTSELPDVSSSATLPEKVYNCLSAEPVSLDDLAAHLGCPLMDVGLVLDDLREEGEAVAYDIIDGAMRAWLTA